MESRRRLAFGAFHIDPEDGRLWRDDEQVDLRPKAFALLRYLLERRGQLVTKDDLLKNLWANATVSNTVLKVCVREIREALGEDAPRPRFIETVPRRGYRFIGSVSIEGTARGEPEPGDPDMPFGIVVGRRE